MDNTKEQFILWLGKQKNRKDTKYSISSINIITETYENCLKSMNISNVPYLNIFEYTKLEDFIPVYNKIIANPLYRLAPKDGGDFYTQHSKYVSYYKKFLEEIENFEISDVYPDEVNCKKYQEGSVVQVLVNKYERNPVAKRKCIEHFGVECQICGFKFSEKYGKIFENKIHVHHKKPLSEIGKEYEIDPITDLIPVCPNCHMILHSKGKNEVYSVDEVKKMIKENS